MARIFTSISKTDFLFFQIEIWNNCITFFSTTTTANTVHKGFLYAQYEKKKNQNQQKLKHLVIRFNDAIKVWLEG